MAGLPADGIPAEAVHGAAGNVAGVAPAESPSGSIGAPAEGGSAPDATTAASAPLPVPNGAASAEGSLPSTSAPDAGSRDASTGAISGAIFDATSDATSGATSTTSASATPAPSAPADAGEPTAASTTPGATSQAPAPEREGVGSTGAAPSAPAPADSLPGDAEAVMPKSATGAAEPQQLESPAPAKGAKDGGTPARASDGESHAPAPQPPSSTSETSTSGNAPAGHAALGIVAARSSKETGGVQAPGVQAAQTGDQPRDASVASPGQPSAGAEAPTGGQALGASGARWAAPTQQQIEALRASVELATRDGRSQARISLEPEELGAVHIRLTQTAAGLVARVSAESAAGAQAIAAGQNDLRGLLGSLGVSLLHLDVGTSASNGRDAQWGAGAQPRRETTDTTSIEEATAPAPVLSAGAGITGSGHLRSIDVLA
jgi:flagellar hook-length control protein FliK